MENEGTNMMQVYCCESCQKSYENYQDLQHIDSIIEQGICCVCRNDAAYCTQCNMYYFYEEAHAIIENESNLCTEHYQSFFDKEYSAKLVLK